MSDVAAGPRQIYQVALAAIIGSIIEQYDFLVTGVIAATVWGGIFFKEKGLAAVAAARSRRPARTGWKTTPATSSASRPPSARPNSTSSVGRSAP